MNFLSRRKFLEITGAAVATTTAATTLVKGTKLFEQTGTGVSLSCSSLASFALLAHIVVPAWGVYANEIYPDCYRPILLHL